MCTANVRAPAFHIIENGVADVLRQREKAWSAAFSSYLKSAVLPIDVCVMQMQDIASAQSKPNQEQNHRPISRTLRFRSHRSNPSIRVGKGGFSTGAPARTTPVSRK